MNLGRIGQTFVLLSLSAGVGGASGCLDRPVVASEPQTSNIFVDVTAQRNVDKIDLLFMIDNSASMSDKQEILKLAVPQLLGRLLSPLCLDASGNGVPSEAGTCPAGYFIEYEAVDDIHIGVISSSLGSPGAKACAEQVAHGNDSAHLLARKRTRADGSALNTYQGLGFLAWDPKGKKAKLGLPPGESDPARLIEDFQELVVATDEQGCGYEASLEAWYRFLVDPAPPTHWVVENNVARPEGLDTDLLEQRRQFLRPDSLLAIVMLSDENDCSLDFRGDGWLFAYNGEQNPSLPWHLPRATSACADDPDSVCCRPCQTEAGPPSGCVAIADDPACSADNLHDSISDARNLRCFNQKRRFGAERLHSPQRYIDALSLPTVLAHDGSEHRNPLFTDLNTGAVASRGPELVFLAGIVGVPWQDIATSASKGPGSEQTLRYQNAAELAQSGAWNLVLGDTANRLPPLDPLMQQSILPRQGTTPDGYPIASPEAALLANPINGHEYYPLAQSDLQYACIFPLETPVECQGNNCDCDRSQESLSPLCQASDGQYTETQRFAKAYPGLRQLEVLKGLGDSGVVASICPKLLPPQNASGTPNPNVGYNPAVESILDVIGTKLGGKCVPRQLAPEEDTGRVPCAMVEVLPQESGQCESCASIAGRIDPSAAITRSVFERMREAGRCTDGACSELCLCEIKQATGADLAACQNDAQASTPGYCYIDATLKLGDATLLGDCPNQRGLRFVGEDTPRNGAQTFIACVGAPFADVQRGN